MAHAQPHQQLMPDIALGGVDRPDRLLRLMIITSDGNKDLGAFAVRCEHDLCDVTQRYAGVAELAFDDDADFFLERLAYALPMVLPAPLFRHDFYFPIKNL